VKNGKETTMEVKRNSEEAIRAKENFPFKDSGYV